MSLGMADEKANETFKREHGYEDPDYLERMLKAARRHAEAAAQVMAEVYGRYMAAIKAEWESYTDAEIMASEHLRRRLCDLAERESWASARMRALGPKFPWGRLTLHDEGDGNKINWMPTFEVYTLERSDRIVKEVPAAAAAVIELGKHWAFGRRLIKLDFMCPDLGEVGARVWVEYEPATEQGRVMTKDNRYADAEQLVYGPVTELLSAASEHVALLERTWDCG